MPNPTTNVAKLFEERSTLTNPQLLQCMFSNNLNRFMRKNRSYQNYWKKRNIPGKIMSIIKPGYASRQKTDGNINRNTFLVSATLCFNVPIPLLQYFCNRCFNLDQ